VDGVRLLSGYPSGENRGLSQRQRLGLFRRGVLNLHTGSEIEVYDQFTADQCHDRRNLCDYFLVFGVLGKAILRLSVGHPISILHDDHPLPDILACLETPDPISHAVFDPTWTVGRDFAIENGRNAGG
jgi:hypothetical protein